MPGETAAFCLIEGTHDGEFGKGTLKIVAAPGTRFFISTEPIPIPGLLAGYQRELEAKTRRLDYLLSALVKSHAEVTKLRTTLNAIGSLAAGVLYPEVSGEGVEEVSDGGTSGCAYPHCPGYDCDCYPF